MRLDKFYTKDDVAANCVNWLWTYFDLSTIKFIEPSAGSGVFLQYLPNYEAYDIAPEGENIIEADFLKVMNTDATFAIGNPPFGKRSALAIDFVNHCSTMVDAIAFIVPVSFMKWSVQKCINSNLKLVDWFYLDKESFTSNGKDFSVRCVFQLWVKRNGKYDRNYADHRLLKQPPIKHKDFDIWQYNATPQAMGAIDEPWTIATYRQGYHDYNQLFSRDDYDDIYSHMSSSPKQQFFFIKPHNDEVEARIRSMDFNALAERNTATPGFGKADFVSYYTELFEQS